MTFRVLPGSDYETALGANLDEASSSVMTRARLFWELGWAQLLLWVAGAGTRTNATPEVHLYLADLHFRLAAEYDRLRQPQKARRHRDIANRHAVEGPQPEPPKAAAMAMPVPQTPIFTDARGRYTHEPTDDVA